LIDSLSSPAKLANQRSPLINQSVLSIPQAFSVNLSPAPINITFFADPILERFLTSARRKRSPIKQPFTRLPQIKRDVTNSQRSTEVFKLLYIIGRFLKR